MRNKKILVGAVVIVLVVGYVVFQIISPFGFLGIKKVVCEARSGRWAEIRNPSPQPNSGVCTFKMLDGGKFCTDSDQCLSSRCVAVQENSTSGRCAEWNPFDGAGECDVHHGQALCWAY